MTLIRDGFQSADLDAPVVLPTLNLDFANSQSLDERITFSRGSIGTFVNKNGLIETAPANTPRFDYDPISGECRGLLIEESGVNQLTNSIPQDSTWSTVNCSITANSEIAPDGTQTASLINSDLTHATRYINLNSSITSGTTYTQTFFVKAGTTRFVQVAPSTGFSSELVNFELTGDGVIGTSTVQSASIQRFPNGWYRISVTQPGTTTTGAGRMLLVLVTSLTSGRLGASPISSCYVWGAQLEQGAFPTSYIPTGASTVTRSADLASMTGTNFSSWYNQTESTIFCEFNAYNNIGAGQKNIIDIRGPEPLGLNRVQMQLNYVSATSQPIYHNLYQFGPNFADYFGFSYTTGPTKNIMRYKDLDTFVASKDGNIRSNTSRTKTIPLTKTMNSLTFGTFNGAISRFAYYPKALNDAEIQYLTV